MAEPLQKVRYAVVGAGHIAQSAMLPAFARAERSELAAIVTGDPDKAKALGQRYRVETTDYDGLPALLASGRVDAVYIATPNHLHCEQTVLAAQHGVHVLCEKPMAVTEAECDRMHEACDDHGVRLMIAYRLHFDPTTLDVRERIRKEIGEPRYFSATFSQRVRPGDIRLKPHDEGGGPLYDIGVYCINAARLLFGDEPVRATAFGTRIADPRFAHSDTSVAVTLQFPGDRLASFVCSFDAFGDNRLHVVGTEGAVLLEPAFGYDAPMTWRLRLPDEAERSRTRAEHDQFGPELDHLSACILDGHAPEPDWREGKADVRIVRALLESAAEGGRPVHLEPVDQRRRPTRDQAVSRPPVAVPPEVDAGPPTLS
ncbi:MAG: Gfo/Idh/MocA family oxidoreductase [Myxococcota bacterium]